MSIRRRVMAGLTLVAIPTIAGCSGTTLSVASGDSLESGDEVIDFLVFLLRVIVGCMDMG